MAGFFSKAMAAASDAYEMGASTVSSVSSQVTAHVPASVLEKIPAGVLATEGAAADDKAAGTAGGTDKAGAGGASKKEGEKGEGDGAEEDGEKKTEEETFGRLEFKLDYNFDKSILNVTVIQAEELPAMDIGGTSDPYCRVYILPDKKKKFDTKKHKKTLNPVFNETFAFPKIVFNEVTSKTLVFCIYDHDAVGADDQIGEVNIPLGSIDLAADNIQMWKEIKEPPKNVLGDICFSLRYVAKKSTLTCMIIECKQLKAMDVLTGSSDPYVKVNLMQGGKRVKKVKTAIKMKEINPYFNQSFKFEVKSYEINKTEVHIFVMDYDRLGSNDAIGWVKLSLASEGTPGKHWRDMLTSNGRSIAQWHALQPFEEEDEKK